MDFVTEIIVGTTATVLGGVILYLILPKQNLTVSHGTVTAGGAAEAFTRSDETSRRSYRVPFLFALTSVVGSWGSARLFDLKGWRFPGWETVTPWNSGAIAAAAIATIFIVLTVLVRGRKISGAEIGFLWIGWIVYSGHAVIAFTSVLQLTETTAGLLVTVFVLASSAAQIIWRWDRISGVEGAIYWLGCSLAGTWALLFLFHAMRPAVVVGWGQSVAGLFVVCITAVFLMAWRRGQATPAEIAVYWCGVVLTASSLLLLNIDVVAVVVSAIGFISVAVLVIGRRAKSAYHRKPGGKE